MKKTPLRKKGKSDISILQRKIWKLCKEITRKKYGNTCYTCGQKGLIGSNWHTGHMWPKASLGALLKYDLRILRPQCFNCNINLGGMGAEFYRKMMNEIGVQKMTVLELDKRKIVKAYDHYSSLIPVYKEILEKLSTGQIEK